MRPTPIDEPVSNAPANGHIQQRLACLNESTSALNQKLLLLSDKLRPVLRVRCDKLGEESGLRKHQSVSPLADSIELVRDDVEAAHQYLADIFESLDL